MVTVATVLEYISFVFFLGLILGMIKPKLAFCQNRKQVFKIYFSIFLVVALAGQGLLELSPERAEQKQIMALAQEQIELGNYSEALGFATEADGVLSNDDSTKLITRINALLESRQNYISGVELLEQGEYVQAIDAFKLVLADDKVNYPLAQDGIAQALVYIAPQLLAQAEELYDDGEYIAAFETLVRALEYDPELARALELYPYYSSRVLSSYYQEAVAQFNQGNYVESIRVLDNIISIDDQDEYAYAFRGAVNINKVLKDEWATFQEPSRGLLMNISDVLGMRVQVPVYRKSANDSLKAYAKVDQAFGKSRADFAKAIELNANMRSLHLEEIVELMDEMAAKNTDYYNKLIEFVEHLGDAYDLAKDIDKLEARGSLATREIQELNTLMSQADTMEWALERLEEDIENIEDMLFYAAKTLTPSQEALLHAFENRYDSYAITQLLKGGADPNGVMYFGRPLLEEACIYRKDVNLVRAFLMAGADPDTKRGNGEPVIAFAYSLNELDIVLELIKAGANPNVYIGQEPLLTQAIASGRGRDFVATLIDAGAELNVRSSLGRTPLQVARHRGIEEVIALLEEVGAP